MPTVVYPDNFDIQKFSAKYKILPEYLTCSAPNYLHYPPGLDINEADLLDCIADPPGPPPPTVEERVEAAELMIGLILDTQQESA